MKCRLRVILDERGIKHRYIAKNAEISEATLSSLINNKRLPTLPVAFKIARVLDLKTEDIWYFEENEK